MQKLVLEIDSCLEKSKMSLLEMFKMIDTDDSTTIELEEFGALLKNMGLQVNSQDVEAMFSDIDLKNSKRITYDQLVVYFMNCKKQAKRVERINSMMERTKIVKQ